VNTRRLFATIKCDIRLQARNGFYYATAFVTLVWALALSMVSGSNLEIGLDTLMPVFILDSMLVGTFYFLAGLVLLEKGEGTMEAQVVSPLRAGEYLLSKIITLALLSMAQYLLITLVFHGFTPDLLFLVAGVGFASALYVLVGFVSVARYTSISDYLFPSILYAGLLLLPLAAYVLEPGGWVGYLVYLHPMEAPLQLMHAAFGPVEEWQIAYGLLYSGLWVWLLYRWSLGQFFRFVVSKAGAGGA